MDVKQIVQASVNIIRITNLKKGDVYKRVEEGSTYSGPKMVYGIVIDLLNDGNGCFVEALEYNKDYSNISMKVVIFSAKKEESFFPASLEEVKEYLRDALRDMEKDIEQKTKELENKVDAHRKAQMFVDGELSKKLTIASFEELPTGTPELLS